MAGSNVYLVDNEAAATPRSLAAIIAAIDLAASTSPTAHTVHGDYCSWFAIQNKHATESLFYQTDSTAASGANIEIASLPGYKLFGPKINKYDLREQFFRVQTNSNDFTIEIHWD